MAFDRIWEQVHATHRWGAYPKEELVRYVCREFPAGAGGARVLDLGCGQGASAWFLAREGFAVTGVDGSTTALWKARQRINQENLRFDGVACCMTALPFAEGSFDLVVDVVSSVHNCLTDMRRIFEEVARVLKPGGKFFSMMPTNRSSRRPFMGYGSITFSERVEVDLLLEKYFDDLTILASSYQLAQNCLVENWVITGSRLNKGA